MFVGKYTVAIVNSSASFLDVVCWKYVITDCNTLDISSTFIYSQCTYDSSLAYRVHAFKWCMHIEHLRCIGVRSASLPQAIVKPFLPLLLPLNSQACPYMYICAQSTTFTCHKTCSLSHALQHANTQLEWLSYFGSRQRMLSPWFPLCI